MIVERLKKDEISLGKVPDTTMGTYTQKLAPLLDKEGNLSWLNFRKSLSLFPWRPLQYHEVEGKINKIYKDAQELFHNDKQKECLERVLDALKIEKHFIPKNDRYTKTKKFRG